MDITASCSVLLLCLMIVLLTFLRACDRAEMARAISDMLSAATNLDNDEERDRLLRRVVAFWDLGAGDAVGSCQSLPQKLVPVFVNLFSLNSTLCKGWRKVIHDRHFGGNRSSEK